MRTNQTESARLSRRCLRAAKLGMVTVFLFSVIRYHFHGVTHLIRSARRNVACEGYASRTIFERNRRAKFELGFVQTAFDRWRGASFTPTLLRPSKTAKNLGWFPRRRWLRRGRLRLLRERRQEDHFPLLLHPALAFEFLG